MTFEVEDLERDFSNSFSGRCNSGFNRDDHFYDQSYFARNRGYRPLELIGRLLPMIIDGMAKVHGMNHFLRYLKFRRDGNKWRLLLPNNWGKKWKLDNQLKQILPKKIISLLVKNFLRI